MVLAVELDVESRVSGLRRVKAPKVLHVFVLLLTAGAAGCAPPIRSTTTTPLTPDELARFWRDIDPSRRDLFYGIGGSKFVPDPDAEYEIVDRDLRGYSTTFDVKDPAGRKWSVKIGPEAQSEVTASRIVWAAGYEQLPSYYLPRWRYTWPDRKQDGSEGPARFRPKTDAFDTEGTWSWHQNPYVGTKPYRGLLVLMMILNSTDLKDDNNALVRRTHDGRTSLTYVVKDLGATFGDTGIHNPVRNDVEAFEKHAFLRGVGDDGRVRFAFKGGHRELIRDIRPADVRWMCERLSRLTDAQWEAAFRAAGQPPDVTGRFIAKLRQKIQEGLALSREARESER